MFGGQSSYLCSCDSQAMWCHDDDAKSGTQRLKGGSNPIGTDHDSQCLDMVGEMPW